MEIRFENNRKSAHEKGIKMHRNVNNLIGYTIIAKDGELGKVDEFFFDDLTWSIRYLVVKTGHWLFERKVLIPHTALGTTDWKSKTFRVNLFMEQVSSSPDIDAEKTVSRQHEEKLLNYYKFPIYWGDTFYGQPLGNTPDLPLTGENKLKDGDDPHLRSTKKVTGYHIHAKDGLIGHVEDFIVDDKNWNVCFLIVNTHTWLPGRKVLILPRWIIRIDWAESIVYMNLSKTSIEKSPDFDFSNPIGRDYENILLKHYGDI